MSERFILRRGFLSVVGIALVALAMPSAGAADTGNVIAPQNNPPTAGDGWQAATCSLEPCSPETQPLFFTQAAGHPNFGFTQFIVAHTTPLPLLEKPVATLKDIRVDLPVGLSVNPQALPQCALATFESESCPPTSAVGASLVTTSLEGLVAPPAVGIVYNLVPAQGEPALFGFRILGSAVFLKSDVEWSGDYHEGFTIAVPKSPLGEVLKNRLSFNGRAGNGTFLTTPSTCLNPTQAPNQHTYSTFLRADSVQLPDPSFPKGSSRFEASLPPGVAPTGCANVPFEPTVGASSGTAKTDSPDGPTVEVGFPFNPAAPIANSTLRTARVSLPLGAGLNPSAAPGLQACTDLQFGKGTTNAVACPASSEVGTVSIETPVLPAGSLTGKVYLGQQLSRDPTSGNEYRVFIDAESARYGQSVRLVGNVSADPKTGRLTTTVSEAPQLPFTSVKVHFDGAKGTLTSPPTCGPNVTNGRMTPWSGTADASIADKGFALTSAPGGGPCAKTMAARPFAPGFSAASGSTRARAFSPFSVHIDRTDGQQELKGVNITLPPGATAKLKGVPYCPPAKIAAAASSSAAAEKADPSCPAKSLVGVAQIAAGSGPSPLKVDDGKAYLAGPYRGAPLSLAFITPAAAGPFDLGTVVVRAALFVEPETAQVHAVSDPLPDVFGGAKLDLRSIDVDVNRKKFTLNGTNCRKQATTGTLAGGGADPTNAASFSSFPVSSPFQASGCKKLKFRPKLSLKLSGATQRGKDPQLRAVLRARPKDANIRIASVGLPHALFLDQASLATICTRVQFAANNCPKRSIYGHAKATTPLLGKPLKGPVYLRSSSNPLPDLVAHLRGQVSVDLVGKIDAFRGGIRTTFTRVPDVPVSKFVMTLPGGKHGLLAASRNLCEKPVEAIVRFKAQNGRKIHRKSKLHTPCGKKSPGRKGSHGR